MTKNIPPIGLAKYPTANTVNADSASNAGDPSCGKKVLPNTIANIPNITKS